MSIQRKDGRVKLTQGKKVKVKLPIASNEVNLEEQEESQVPDLSEEVSDEALIQISEEDGESPWDEPEPWSPPDFKRKRKILILPPATNLPINPHAKLLQSLSKPLHRNCPMYILGNKLMGNDPKGRPLEIGRMTFISAIKKDIDTGDVTIDLTFDFLDEMYTQVVSREIFTKKKIIDLLKYGADVADCKVEKVLKFLNYQEKLAPNVLTHSNIGWGEREGRLIFKHYQAIGCSSIYSGKLLLQPTGTYQEWLDVINEEVVGHAPLELALVLGLSAPIAALIGKETGIEVLFAHIYGDSTRGKTTAVRIATSTFGYPHTATNGLIKTWNGTANAIQAHLRGNLGIPMALDEASMQSGDFTTQVYQLANGKDKDRCDKDGKLKETSEWSGTVLSTAEHSLHGKSKQNTGALIRLIEIGNITWTKSAQNAETIKRTLLKNYGYAGPEFVKHLMTLGTESIMETWHKWCNDFYNGIEMKNNFSHRIADKYAIILATAEIARNALNLDLNIQGIFYFLAIQQIQVAKGSKLPRNPVFYEYYQRKIGEGKKKRQALVCVMRRLANIIYGMMKNKTAYIMPTLQEKEVA